MSNVSAKIHLGALADRPSFDRSKQLVTSANRELERHQLWLERHHELYSESLEECQRQLERRNEIDACVQAILLPINLLISVCTVLFHRAWVYAHRFRLRAELQSRINAMEQLSRRQLPQALWRAASPPQQAKQRGPDLSGGKRSYVLNEPTRSRGTNP
jgi:hypothetical protein